MSEDLYLTWMGNTFMIQQKNGIVNQQCAELQAKLSADGLRSCILKGQGVAQLYPEDLRMLRQSGDIDAWVKGGFDVVNDFVQKTHPSKDIAYHRFHYHVFEDTEVELHHRPTLMRNLFDNRKLQKWCDSFGADSFVHTDLGFDVPPIEFNRIFIHKHIYRHFLFEGVGLRQVMDYYFVLRTSYDNHNENRLLKEFRLTRFAGALMWVMKEVFGMDDKYLICAPDEKEGHFLLNEIEKMGNFGKTDKRYVGKGKAKCFAGDVGSIGIAFILLFLIGKVIIATGDLTYLVFLLVYGVDGVLTICHWIYLFCALIVLAIAYILFMRKYYWMHEEYLRGLGK